MDSAPESCFGDICRLCAIDSKFGIYIYSAEGENINLEQKIWLCLQIKVTRDDALPKNICSVCKLLLEELHQFLCRATEAQQTLLCLLDIRKDPIMMGTDENLINNLKVEGNYIKNESDESALLSNIDNFDELICELPKLDMFPAMSSVPAPELYEEKPSSHPTNLPMNCKIKEALPLVQVPMNSRRRTNKRKKERRVESMTASIPNIEKKEDISQESPDADIINIEGREFKEDTGRSYRDCSIACMTCDNVFVTRSEFDAHCRNVHGENPTYACPLCDKQTENFNSYRSHFYRHDLKHQCQYCDKKFTLEGHLQGHVLSLHVPVRPYVCNSCGKHYGTKSCLDKHSKLHEEQQNYSCTQCNKTLQTRRGLKAHMVTHALGRHFQCHLCGKTFTQKTNLQTHVNGHSGERQFSCGECNRRFTVKSHLKRHMTVHSNDRPYECLVCNKSFKTERCVKLHAQIHDEVKSYVCDECGKGFKFISKLKQHLNCHASDRPYSCGQCDKKFNDRSNAVKHAQRWHKFDQTTIQLKQEFGIQSLMTMPLQPLGFSKMSNFKEEDYGLDSDPALFKTHEESLFSQLNVSSGDLSEIQLPSEISLE